ncbi:hypothetical protein ACIODW_13765 [Streptomyces sp. NPDC087897]
MFRTLRQVLARAVRAGARTGGSGPEGRPDALVERRPAFLAETA